MATSPDLIDTPDPRRPVDRWLSSYSGDHINPTNQFIHLLCVPAIVWSVTAAFWIIPVPPALAQPGFWMAVATSLVDSGVTACSICRPSARACSSVPAI